MKAWTMTPQIEKALDWTDGRAAEPSPFRPTPDRHSYVYFIGASRGPVKIGVSGNPTARLDALQAGSPAVLSILALRRGDQQLEREYHDRFRKARQHGEWFKRTPALKAEIAHLRPTPSEGEEG